MLKNRVISTISCVALAAVLGFGSLSAVGSSSVPTSSYQMVSVNPLTTTEEYANSSETVIVDGEFAVIEDNEIPLASNSGNTTTTKTSKTTKKTVTNKKAATSSKTVTKKSTKKTTKNAVESSYSVKTVTVAVTTTNTKYTKGSKKATVTTKVDTTVTKTKTKVTNKEVSISSVASKADADLLARFEKEGYKCYINNGVSYSGVFSAKDKMIKLRESNSAVYHELGHYLAYATGRTDCTDEFAAIYKAEKSKYTGSNKSYVTQNASEYFAESYRDYVTNSSSLKSSRPKTYAYIKKVLEML